MLRPGDRWQLQVRLKRPHGMRNPGGFDYERWLFQNQIWATGYVRKHIDNRYLGATGKATIHAMRQRVGETLMALLDGEPQAGLIKALAIGHRDAMSSEQWRVLRDTGTAHLMAISGLHVGLVGGFGFWVGRFFWTRWQYLPGLVPASSAGALSALTGACLYAAMAGFSLSTQRALIMLLVYLAGPLLRRQIAPSVSLCGALLGTLVLDPGAVLGVGFWLSFGAVAVLFFVVCARLPVSEQPWRGLWWRWGRVHVLLALGLAPMSLWFFDTQALLAPIANLIAIPFTSIVLVPLTLIGALLSGIDDALAGWVLIGASVAFDGLWWILRVIADTGPLITPAIKAPGWQVLLAGVGVCLLIAPPGLPGRVLGLGLVLPLFLFPVPRLENGSLRIAVLDVGQGLSTVLETRNHVLVYDTGPRYGKRFDAGQAVIIPYLRSRGISRVDRVILSHGDMDHVGGYESIRRAGYSAILMSNSDRAGPDAIPCYAGIQWRWDGIDFSILHPADSDPGRGNNLSCVLRVDAPGGSVLLPGDIEAKAETKLLQRHPGGLRADVVIVPHHGSTTSSTEQFLEAVQPLFAVFTVGYRNRFGFPRPAVSRRYDARGIKQYNTADNGAIVFTLRPDSGVGEPLRYRQAERRFWPD